VRYGEVCVHCIPVHCPMFNALKLSMVLIRFDAVDLMRLSRRYYAILFYFSMLVFSMELWMAASSNSISGVVNFIVAYPPVTVA
jgi:hypothetical protein